MADKYADRIANELSIWLNKEKTITFKEFHYKGFRADVLEINHNYEVVEYEIKTSVGDYNNDFLKKNKDGSLKHDLIFSGNYCNKFYFVMPPHLLREEDISENYGIIHYTGNGFEIIRGAELLLPVEICEDFQSAIYTQLLKDNKLDEIAMLYHRRSEYYYNLYQNTFERLSDELDKVRAIKEILKVNQDPF